jgi:DNA-binding response OmpR family regulator
MVEVAKSILLVDDDESVRVALGEILKRAGYEVEVAKNGQEALEKIRIKRFDAVLADIKLPDILGTDLLSKLQDNKEMVKIMITGFSTVEDGAKAADCGADDYLVKPVKPEELLRSLSVRLAKL